MGVKACDDLQAGFVRGAQFEYSRDIRGWRACGACAAFPSPWQRRTIGSTRCTASPQHVPARLAPLLIFLEDRVYGIIVALLASLPIVEAGWRMVHTAALRKRCCTSRMAGNDSA